MDPNALLVGALAQAVSNLAEPVVKDAYTALKKLIQEKTGNRTDVQVTLDKHEKSPSAWSEGLKETLDETNAASDPDVIAALKRLEAALAQTSKSAPASHKGDNITGTYVHKGDNISGKGRKITMGDGSKFVEGKED